LEYLHQNDVVHGDIKGLNALVTMEHRVALCDFGLSKLASSINTSTGGLGTPYWQSPELMQDGPRTKAADVYAFGIMVYEVSIPVAKFDRRSNTLTSDP
jgi:serine/threonine protein kinase